MKKILFAFVGVFLLTTIVATQVVIEQRPTSPRGIGYGTAFPTIANSGNPPTDGEVFVIRNPGTTSPQMWVYSDLQGTWLLQNSSSYQVLREDFLFGVSHMVTEAYATAAVTDTSENIIIMPGSPFGLIHFRYEAPGGPGFAGTADPIQDGRLQISNLMDAADNEGVDMTFVGDRNALGYMFNEDLANSVYCETKLRIADVSETDSVYFGWFLVEGYQDAGAVNAHNTYAIFHVLASGDVDIETELNGGGTLADDLGTDYVDNAEHTLRVTMNADTVSFTLNGASVTQTNAVLNADDGDEMVCGVGALAATGDGTPAPGISADYVEIAQVSQ